MTLAAETDGKAREPAGVEILVAEDSRTQAELLKHLLKGCGYVVATAGDGQEGLLAARRRKPTLIVSDVEMPVLSGYGMCRAIKSDPQLRDIPVILLTSLSDPGDVLSGLEAGADYYLTKPYDHEQLLSTVRLALATPVGPEAPASERLEAVFEGRRHDVTAGRRQILTLLLSTYGSAVQRNRELIKTQLDLRKANQELTEQARMLREGEDRLREQNHRLEAAVRSERAAHDELKKTQSHLVQSEKLASLGQMVAGVAHEINNPLAFVSNNVAVLQRDVGAIGELLDLYHEAEVTTAIRPELLKRIQDFCQRLDLGYTLPNLQDLLSSSRDGLKRIQQIVMDLREFARLDESDLSEVDINAGIESTMNIIRNRATQHQVKIEPALTPLPALSCYPAKINQVVLNLLANAIDASKAGDVVTVRTSASESHVTIEVIDSGSGIDPSIRERIFDPFFTTKPPGQGTGLGLSISYGIVEDHGGTIQVESEVGRGSRFIVSLPRRQAST